MDIKVLFAIISAVIAILAFFPYIKDVISRQTQPHEFTWLIWSITQGTAVAGLIYGGGGIGASSLVIGTFLVALVFLLSLRDGKKNIARSDIAVLSVSLLAIVVWRQLHNPILAVLMVSAIDIIGYIPTFRKSYSDPWGETVLSWGAFTASNVFAILALSNYNLLTLSYLTAISLANLSLLVFLLVRRKAVPKL